VTWFLPFFGDEVTVVVEMFGKKSREREGQFWISNGFLSTRSVGIGITRSVIAARASILAAVENFQVVF
jgi:hypothetical protein